MKRLAIMAICVLMGLTAASCGEKASQEECKKMCENLVNLRGKIKAVSAKDLIAKAEEDFKKEEKRLTDWMERDLKGWDDELAAKLAEATTDADKDALKADYEKKKQVTREQHLPGIKELGPKKEAAKKEAQRKADASMSEWNAAVDECVGAALKEGASKKVAECRINAESTDQYWNKCR